MTVKTCNSIPLSVIAQALNPLTDLFIDCDGKTQLAAAILSRSGIPFSGFCGTVQYFNQLVAPHYWIDVPTDAGHYWRIDYALHQWIHSPCHQIAVGVFDPLEYSYLDYQGSLTEIAVLSKPLFCLTQFDFRHVVSLSYQPITGSIAG